MTEIYSAPMNFYSNSAFRHLLLNHKCDYVFTEMILVKYIDELSQVKKIKTAENDAKKTIFQIALSKEKEIVQGINTILKHVPKAEEINLNMGCPQSSMQKNRCCSGILFDKEHMKRLCARLSKECRKYGIIPSIKLRTGIHPEKIEINRYLDILSSFGIDKVYIHARTLKHNYTRAANYTPLKNIKKQFPNMKIILNGDIDSYEAYREIIEEYSCDGIMIGRAALSNPLIFEQIKDKTETRDCPYDPYLKDPTIIIDGQHTKMSDDKKKIIDEFLAIAIDFNIAPETVINNLSYLLKGISGGIRLLKKSRLCATVEDIRKQLIL